MEIKQTKKFYSKVPSYIHNIYQNEKILVIIIYSTIFFILGGITHRVGVFKKAIVYGNAIKNKYINFPSINDISLNHERITIDLKHEDYMRLAYKRSKALKRGMMVQESDDFVTASMDYNGEESEVKIRVKGDAKDNFEDDS